MRNLIINFKIKLNCLDDKFFKRIITLTIEECDKSTKSHLYKSDSFRILTKSQILTGSKLN